MTSGSYRTLLTPSSVLLLSFASLFAAKSHAQDSEQYNSYQGLVLAGYQGWFNCDGDGADKGWKHYSNNNKFEPGACSIDFWPDMSEYKRKYETRFTSEDGSPAYVFSSYDASTVELHFKWMAQYDIDGVFMQRFIHQLTDPRVENHYDTVFESAAHAARKYKRVISIRYDLTQMPESHAGVLLDDLDKLNARYDFFNRTACPTFLHHKGKPLVAIGGVGFADDIAGTDVGYLDEAEVIVSELRKRGYSIMMRVPAQWREFRGSLTLKEPSQQERFHALCQSVDIIMPWHVGAYRERTYVGGNWQQRIADDIAWCQSHNVEYVPVIYPGFSRANLKHGEDGSFRPRNKGSFYWLQASSAVEAGAKMLFVAQFDEMDEGTQIFKCAHRVPVGNSRFVAYDKDIKTDHYLWLTGKVGELLRGEMAFSTTLPQR
jgi:hypothetical protein